MKEKIIIGALAIILVTSILPIINAAYITKENQTTINVLDDLPVPPRPITPFMPYADENTPKKVNKLYTFRTQINFGEEYKEGYTYTLEWKVDRGTESNTFEGGLFIYDGLSGVMQPEDEFSLEGDQQVGTYNIYVRAVNDEGENSRWSIPLAIATPKAKYHRFFNLFEHSLFFEKLSMFLLK